MSSRFLHVLVAVSLIVPAVAQTQPTTPSTPEQSKSSTQKQPEVDPLKRQIDDKTRKKQQKALKKEDPFAGWPDSDAVKWIITDEERDAFSKLTNDEEKENFIEMVWARRDPTPDTVENEYKEEHYRRVAYANEHFSAGKAGWLTDRGHIYIAWGPPDQIESHPTGGPVEGMTGQNGGVAGPYEVWRYRYLQGKSLGQEIEIEFVDTCMCGDYHIAVDPQEKAVLKNVPGHQHDFEITSFDKDSRQFALVERNAAIIRPPEIKFRDLEAQVGHIIHLNPLTFDVRADFVRLTPTTVLVPLSVQIKNNEVVWSGKDGVQRMTVNIFGRVTTITGKIVQSFEDTVTDMVADTLLPRITDNTHVYWKGLPLLPGRYRFDLVVKDVNSDRVGTWSKGFKVPEYEDDKLASSTLILADVMERIARDFGGSFVIGDTKVRPRLDSSDGKPALFKRPEQLNMWMQAYNLNVSEKTHKADATIDYEIVNTTTKRSVWKQSESTAQLPNAGEQITLQKTLPLTSFEPGVYEVTINVTDKVSTQSTRQSARFTVQ